MNIQKTEPKAFFLSPDGKVYPDNLICTGIIPAELDGKPCPHSQNGQFPDIKPLNPEDPTYTIDKGKPDDLCPTCAKQQLAHLGHWQGYRNQNFPEELLSSIIAAFQVSNVVLASRSRTARPLRNPAFNATAMKLECLEAMKTHSQQPDNKITNIVRSQQISFRRFLLTSGFLK